MPGPLTISCEPTLCLRMLIPALSELKSATGLDVRVLAAGGPIDFRRDHIDIAIRRSDFAMPHAVQTVVLAPELMGPVIAPIQVKKEKTLPRLISNTRPDAWNDWAARSTTSITGPGIHYEHFYLAIQAAETGQGTAIASLYMVADAIAADRLCAPHGFTPDGTNYLAIRPAGVVDQHCNTFIAWLIGRMATDRLDQRVSAATPGNSLPSIHSRNAPPAVDTKVKSPPTPA